MTDQECKNFLTDENGKIKTMGSLKPVFRNNKNLLQYIESRYDDSSSLKESVYRIVNDIDERPKCVCGKQLDFIYLKNCFKVYCCKNCQNSDPEKIKKDKMTKLKRYGNENYNNHEKQEQTTLERYGTTSFSKTEEYKEKTKNTCQKKYGTDWWLQTKEAKEREKKTKLEKYGDENYNNREKAAETSLERYNVPNTKQWIGAIVKDKQTCLERYGVTSYAKTDEFKQKVKETSLKKWGVDNCTKSKEWTDKWYSNKEWLEHKISKTYETMLKNDSFSHSKPEEIILKYLIENYPDTIYQYREKRYPFKCDFYIPSKDLFIEYNGYWTHGKHFFDQNNPEDIEKLKLWESKNNKIYKSAIKTWTVLDPLKIETMKKNNLNHIILWYDDFKDLENIKRMVDMF